MMSMNNKNRRTVVMSSAGFLVKTGVQEMLVINLKLSLSCFFYIDVKIRSILDPIYSGQYKFFNGQKLARICLSFTGDPRNCASF